MDSALYGQIDELSCSGTSQCSATSSADLLMLSAHSSALGASSEEIEEEERWADPHAKGGIEDVRARLQTIQNTADDVLKRIELITKKYFSEDSGDHDHCSIVGIAKFRKKVVKERDNASSALASLSASTLMKDDGEDEDGQNAADNTLSMELSKAYLIARCTSMEQLELTVRCMETEPNVVGVCVPILPVATTAGSKGSSADPLNRATLEVDIISCGGMRWVKVRSTSQRALQMELEGQHVFRSPHAGSYTQLLGEYVRRSSAYMLAFKRKPEVAVLFLHSTPKAFLRELRAVKVVAAVSHTTELNNNGRSSFFPPLALDPLFVCLDTTALVALCSETCHPSLSMEEQLHGLAKFSVLCEQCRQEQVDPAVQQHIDLHLGKHSRWATMEEHLQCMLKTVCGTDKNNWRARYTPVSISRPDLSWLEALLINHDTANSSSTIGGSRVVSDAFAHMTKSDGASLPNWVVADVSYHEFKWILETIAGPRELRRALRLLSCVLVVDTAFLRRLPEPLSDLKEKGHLVSYLQLLSTSGKVLVRNRVVFSMADALHAIAITSNRQLVNAAKQQQLHVLVAPHPTRSLTEQKMYGIPRREGARQPPLFPYESTD